MFGNMFPKEEFIEKIADEALALSAKDVISLTDAVIKKASDYGLNKYQIENVCARVNHKKFQEKFAEDKLSTFDIANIDDVLNAKQQKVAGKVKKVVIKSASERVVFIKEAAEEEDLGDNAPKDVPFVDMDHRQAEATSAMAIDNADNLSVLQDKSDLKELEVFNTVKELVKHGVSLRDVYEVMLKTWGEDDEPAVQSKFQEILDKLKREGYYPEGERFVFPKKEDIPKRACADSRLSEKVAELLDINDEIFKREFVHLNAIKMLKEAGRKNDALMISKMAECQILTEENVKLAAQISPGQIPLGAGMGYSTSFSNLVSPVIADSAANPAMRLQARNVAMRGFLGRLAPVAAIMGGAYAARKIGAAMKRSRVYDELINSADFRDVDKKKFEKLFDTIVKHAPVMLDTPYALGELIKKHLEYGTIDVTTLKDLGKMNAESQKGTLDLASTAIKATGLLGN